MNAITTVGLDIAKSVFQVHGVDAQGTRVQNPRRPAVPRQRPHRGRIRTAEQRYPNEFTDEPLRETRLSIASDSDEKPAWSKCVIASDLAQPQQKGSQHNK